MENNALLEAKDLGKVYKEKKALNRVNLRLERGEILGLVGPNGAGKTTFLKLVLGLISPTSGTIKVFGRNLESLGREERQRIGYIADESNLYEYLTVEEMIRFNQGFYPRWNKKRCQDLVERMNLPLKERVKNLSKGMKTQLSLILALIPNPQLLLMDEPLEGLDPVRRIQLLNTVLEDFSSSEERSIIISSHHLEELERLAGRVVFMHQGEIKKESSMDDFKGKEKTLRIVFQKEPPPSLFSMEGIARVTKEGDRAYLIAIEDNFPAIYEACSKEPHFVLEIYHRNLEDLFYEYQGSDQGV